MRKALLSQLQGNGAPGRGHGAGKDTGSRRRLRKWEGRELKLQGRAGS